MVGVDQTPAPDGPHCPMPAFVAPVAFGGSTKYVFQTRVPSAARSAVMLPRNVQHAYCGSIARVSSHDAAGTNTMPSLTAGEPVNRVASCASIRFLQLRRPVFASSE